MRAPKEDKGLSNVLAAADAFKLAKSRVNEVAVYQDLDHWMQRVALLDFSYQIKDEQTRTGFREMGFAGSDLFTDPLRVGYWKG